MLYKFLQEGDKKMKQLKCEMCGSADIVKQDGVFVCQSCGTKYSVEEAKKMMVEGTVEVQGTVKVDSSEDLKKLYQAARNARETCDDATALKHYENISAKDPDSWEALFYLVILKTKSIKNGEIASSAISVANGLNRVFQLIKETVSDKNEQKKCVKEVVEECLETSVRLLFASESFYKTVTKGNGLIALTGVIGAASSLNSTGNALVENKERYSFIADIMCACGDNIEHYFDLQDKDYREYAVSSWKQMIDLDVQYKMRHGSYVYDKQKRERYINKLNKYEPSYRIKSSRELLRETQAKSAVNTSAGWGKFKAICMIIFCLFPITGSIISGLFLNEHKNGISANLNIKVAKITLLINIILTILTIVCVPILIYFTI